jgi:hypothetical protein
VAFSHEETSLLLNGAGIDQIPPETLQKLEQIDMLNDLQIIPRNLAYSSSRDSEQTKSICPISGSIIPFVARFK